MAAFIKAHPVQLYGLAVAILVLVGCFVVIPATVITAVLGVVTAVLALFGANAVQRVEDGKTAAAAASTPPAGE